MEVVIDTNFLLSALKFKVKMPAGKLVILSGVVRELERIAGSRGRDALLAKTALQIIEKRSARKISTRGHVDTAILRYAAAHRCAVATNDKKLIKALKAKGIKVIRIRQRKYATEE